ncbi:MAG TPA: UV DNA damage repair endonuclease UvsE [Oscillospiraceae bacterium]|nr:UV DNA damage repair endonuclease UvsE [Oscillospiraceae bacterium]
MLIRFGFVAMSTVLENASPSQTVTWKTYQKIRETSTDAAIEKLLRVARQNLKNSLRLLQYCQANFVQVYRFSSKIIPLATHPEVEWNYLQDLQPELQALGEYIITNKLRVTFHPDHFIVLNSPREVVFKNAVADLAYHSLLLTALQQDDNAKLVIHVGGSYGNKETALERFMENWSLLPTGAAKRVILENDDRTYTANETLTLCEKLQVPMVLDVHHDWCNHEPGRDLTEIYARFVGTWQATPLPPKIHVSSPKCTTAPRSHHNYVDAAAVYLVLKQLQRYTSTLDVMVEAKQKDQAMLRLVEDLGRLAGVKLLNRATLVIE